MTAPDDFPRRSFVARRLSESGARFGDLDGAAVALDFGDAAAEAEAAKRLGLADLSTLPRTGFKGAGTADWLAGQGLEVPAESNRAARQPGGELAARLAPGEVLILGDLAGRGGRFDRAAGDSLVKRAAAPGEPARLSRAAPRQPRLVPGQRQAVRGHVRQALRCRPAAGPVP